MKIIALIINCLLIAACASPYQSQANILTRAYQNGEISANDYHVRMTELQALDLQRRVAISQAFMQAGQNMANRPRPIMQPCIMQNTIQPRTTSGTIYTPGGQIYQYNSTTY